jgi:hypothetical protein
MLTVFIIITAASLIVSVICWVFKAITTGNGKALMIWGLISASIAYVFYNVSGIYFAIKYSDSIATTWWNELLVSLIFLCAPGLVALILLYVYCWAEKKRCPNCGAKMERKKKFCTNCGMRLIDQCP